MKILALEFSSDQRSVALVESREGSPPRCLAAAAEVGSRTMRALAMIERALAEARMEREEVDCIAVGIGPGSYTGIRAAISLAQGWQLARDVSLLAVSSVECLAAQAQAQGRRGRVHIAIDAQRNEVYLATFDADEDALETIEPLRISSADEVRRRAEAGETVIGPEVNRWTSSGHILFPEAAALGRLAAARSNFIPGEKLEPIYLRETTFVKAPPPRLL